MKIMLKKWLETIRENNILLYTKYMLVFFVTLFVVVILFDAITVSFIKKNNASIVKTKVVEKVYNPGYTYSTITSTVDSKDTVITIPTTKYEPEKYFLVLEFDDGGITYTKVNKDTYDKYNINDIIKYYEYRGLITGWVFNKELVE
jgi:hypothetical protein